MASKTRSSTKNNNNNSTPKPQYLNPKIKSAQNPNPNPSPVSDVASPCAAPECSKRRRLNKGKMVVDSDSDSVAEIDVVVCDGVKHQMFREFMPQATASGLDKLRLTKEERKNMNRVAKYSIHGGRSYSKAWCNKHVALKFFVDFLKFQGWEKVASFMGPIYPIEVIQFYATVSFRAGVLHAMVNGREVSISVDEFCTLFSIPDEGIEINPSLEWGEMTVEDKLSTKKYFDDASTVTSMVLTNNFSPKVKFLFNFLWNTIVPRRGGRDKVSSYEMIVVRKWLEGEKVNLGLLVLFRILQTSYSVREDKVYTTLDLPYGMWISHLLEERKVVDESSYGVIPRDDMNDTYLKFMKIAAVGPELVFQVKGSPSVETPMVLDISSLETKIDLFMGSVMERLDAQEKRICEVMAQVARESAVVASATRADGAATRGLDGELKAFLARVEAKLGKVSGVADRSMHECIRTHTGVQNLMSQGGGLLISGNAMKDEMHVIHEAVKALTLRIGNFDACLVAQSTHIASCLDRLDSLEFRTRPGYVDPTRVRHNYP